MAMTAPVCAWNLYSCSSSPGGGGALGTASRLGLSHGLMLPSSHPANTNRSSGASTTAVALLFISALRAGVDTHTRLSAASSSSTARLLCASASLFFAAVASAGGGVNDSAEVTSSGMATGPRRDYWVKAPDGSLPP